MLRIMGSERQFCDGVTRREMLQVGGAGLMGFGLSDLLANGGAAAPSVVGSATDLAGTFGKAKRAVLRHRISSRSSSVTSASSSTLSRIV